MKAIYGSSKILRLENPKACAVLADREQLRLLGAFLARENTISSAAEELGVNPTKLYKQVQRFLELGLVKITRFEKRNGRATKYYRSSSDQFFIPFRMHPPELIGYQNRQHHTLVRTGFRAGVPSRTFYRTRLGCDYRAYTWRRGVFIYFQQ